ncbi:MAG: hypothetical protein HUJ51_04725 [Eggerthellaceae bacterium]|nr:hypothetical protein [Eggerthellaceae bacterium]
MSLFFICVYATPNRKSNSKHNSAESHEADFGGNTLGRWFFDPATFTVFR